MTTLTRPPDLALRSLEATWNRARWEELPDDGNRYEVIDGVLYMTTAPSSFHQWIVARIYRVLAAQMDDRGLGYTFLAPIGLFMPGCDPVQPDLVMVPTADQDIIHDRRIFGVPALLVEVLSPSNATQDTEIKKRAYAEAGLPEYWIIRPAQRDMIVYTDPDPVAGDYARATVIAPDGVLSSPTLPISVAIASFFAGAPDTTL